jgi:hypothetical protein
MGVSYHPMDRDVDVVRGEHSGIPPCCIEFFVTTWRRQWHDPRRAGIYRARIRMAGLRQRRRVGYIPCPECLDAHRFVRIHTCSKRCAGQPGASL